MSGQLIDRSSESVKITSDKRSVNLLENIFPLFQVQTFVVIFAAALFHFGLQAVLEGTLVNSVQYPALLSIACLCLAILAIYRGAISSTIQSPKFGIFFTLGLSALLAFALTMIEERLAGFSEMESLRKGAYYFLLLGVSGAVFLALAHNEARKLALAKAAELEIAARTSQLKALRYQLNPHFIFNALNSVSSLVIDERNADAERLVEALSDYMRTVLDEDKSALVPLVSEVTQQKRYLEIEQVRFPSRLSFEVNISDAASTWQIPVLILQPLVENAIKHGVAKQSDPVHIVISAMEVDARLQITVSNTGRMNVGLNTPSEGGTGLENVRDRLQSLYGDAAGLDIGNAAKGNVHAILTIPKEAYLFPDNAI